MSLIDHEATHADRAALGVPFLQFVLRDASGRDCDVTVWAPPPTPWEDSTFRGWLRIQGHPAFDSPRRVLGEGPWQPVWLAVQVIEQFATERDLTRVVTS